MTEHDASEALPAIATTDAIDLTPGGNPNPIQTIHVWGEAKALIRDVLFAALTAILLLVFVIQPVKVEGTSMLPRLHDGERIFVNKFVYAGSEFPTSKYSVGRPIERGDVVVFWYPKDPDKSFIKRVIGLPGEVVRIDTDGKVFINGKILDEPYLSPEFSSAPQKSMVETVEVHHYFVMGDNRDHSNDSRHWGQVPEKYIYGQASIRYWPLSGLGSVE